MASSELSTSDPLGRALAVRRVDAVDPTATVRHVDQLETDTLQQFYELLEGSGTVPADEVDLEAGTVVVFTDYFLVDSV